MRPYPFQMHWLSVLLCLPLLAEADNRAVNADDDGVAIHGYDPVAYFVSGRPRKGRADLAYHWSGADWWFATPDNRSAFVAGPERYAPRFGGFCAYAASYGLFADVDPQAWTIHKGRLYLNYSLRVRETWRPRADEFIGDAEQLWPDMRQTTEEGE